uniref:tRNA (34-2'-O)-methyltransferase regulator WDR6 n=1 Tax=Haemonchus contortus TaxID=6289 RepID=A0A7I5EDJ2_HAECO
MLSNEPKMSICRRLTMEERNGYLLCGHGSCLEIYNLTTAGSKTSIRLLPGEDIHRIQNCEGGVLVLGERSMTYVSDAQLFNEDRKADVPASIYFDDHPLDVTVFDNTQQVALLFGTYSVALYDYEVSPLKLTMKQHVRSERFALILSSILVSSSWDDLVVIAGTMDGEILVTVPSTGPVIRAKFEGHRGMIFGLDLCKDRLYSIADDRCLCVWDAKILDSVPTDSACVKVIKKLDAQFGHAARPYSICHDSDGNIYTAGDDEIVCKWIVEDDCLKMLYQKEVQAGSIRAIRVVDEKLCIASGSGALATVPVNELAEDFEVRCTSIPDLRAFARMRDRIQCLQENSCDEFQRGIRSLARSPLYVTSPIILAYIGDMFCHFFIDERCVWLKCEFGSHILSVTICEKFALVYQTDRTGVLLDVANQETIAVLDFSGILSSYGMKSHIKITSMALIMVEQSMFIMVGTVSGHVFFAKFAANSTDVSMASTRKLNACFEAKAINQVRNYNENIFLLGSNGVLVLCKYDANSSVEVISAGPACPWLRGFTPCSFSPDNKFIFGFHARNFYVVDVRNGDTLCTVPCGGIHRQWYFTFCDNYDVLREGEVRLHRATFDFLRKGSIVSIDLYLKRLPFLEHCVHRTQVVGVCLLDETDETIRAITIGADYFIRFSQMQWKTGAWSILLSLYNPSAPTCVRSSSLPFGGCVIIAGGEKGTVTAWMVGTKALEDGNSYTVRSALYQRSGSSARVVDLDVTQVSNNQHLSAVSYADGQIERLNLYVDEDRGVRLEKEIRYPVLASPNLSIFSKVATWTDVDGTVYLCAASTSGNLFLWKSAEKPEPICTIFVERCGLSALAFLCEGTQRWLAVGSESGTVTVFAIHGATLEKLTTLTYHSATITGVAIQLNGKELQVLSVALDCRFAAYSIDLNTKQASFLHAVPLDVRDPSSLLVTKSGAIVVGNGLETVSNVT